jgi:hypothetical protein
MAKRIVSICLFCVSVEFYACNQPAPTQPSFSGRVSISGYGESLDSTYYKVWSDSSWEEFYQDTVINGNTYTTILDSYGNEYYYDSSGYAGFKLPQLFGDIAVIFDSSLSSLPDTMVGGLNYLFRTTFSLQGINYGLIDQETLVDTSTVGVPFGTFTNCPGIQSSQAITSGGMVVAGNDVLYWLAKGPSDIERDFIDYGSAIVMAYGFVNGRSWGVGLMKGESGSQRYQLSQDTKHLQRGSSAGSKSSTFDIRVAAPLIFKGIIR